MLGRVCQNIKTITCQNVCQDDICHDDNKSRCHYFRMSGPLCINDKTIIHPDDRMIICQAFRMSGR